MIASSPRSLLLLLVFLLLATGVAGVFVQTEGTSNLAQVSSGNLQSIFFSVQVDGGTANGRTFTVSLFSGGQNKVTTTGVGGSTGLIPFSANLSPGTYSVRLETQGFLSREQVFNLNSNQTYTFTNKLLAGDLNGDDVINSLDWSSMFGVWFTNSTSGDLNKDNIVNSLDRALLVRNWFLRADNPIITTPPPPPPPVRTTYDWCASIVIRPDTFISGPPTCTTRLSKVEVAQANIVYMSGEFNVAASEVSTNPPLRFQLHDSSNSSNTSTCWYDGYKKPSNIKKFTDELKTLRSSGLPPLISIYAARFDLVTSPESQVAGFKSSWAVDSATPWTTFQSFITTDRSSPDCINGCRWSDSDQASNPALDGADIGYRLRDALDRSGGPNTYQKKVYYLTRGYPGKTVFYPNGLLMRQNNAEYQVWAVTRVKKEMGEAGSTYVELNNKFFQYKGSKYIGNYPGGLSNWNRIDDSYFTGELLNYGLAEYVAGWRGMANELKRQGVPYSVTVGQWYAKTGGSTSDYYDDPSTPTINEADTIRSVIYDADLVLLDGTQGSLDAIKAEILSHGDPIIIEVNTGCGEATS